MSLTSSKHTVTRSELLSALSYALDITEGQAEGHGIRCCWIGTHIGRVIGLPEEELTDLYYTLLLKDIGCSSNAARICQLYLTDDRTFKRDHKLVGESLPQVLQFVLSHTGMNVGLAERFRTLITVFKESGTIAKELIDIRCQRGADIVRRMRFPERVAKGILDLDEHWNGKGQPTGLAGNDISLYARIALLAQVTDVFWKASGPAEALNEVTKRAGSWFDPMLAEAFRTVAADPAFWEGLASADLGARIVTMMGDRDTQLDDDYFDDIAAAFADVIDSKSPFTAGHSRRVALFTYMIAEEMELGDEDRRLLRRGALLHDIGKLGVSNQILDKNGKLDEAEWISIQNHPGLGEQILSRIEAFRDLAQLAGSHHERLDGKGYPRGLKGDAIPLFTRILTVADIFDALTADRPYRAAMPVSKALEIMRRDVDLAIDGSCFQALQRALQKVEQAAA
jgi:putative nucleotidyltransferase with HDIG domain